MQWVEVKVTFSGENEIRLAEEIGDIFQDLDTNGVVIDDPQLKPAEEWGDDALGPAERHAVTGYFQVDAQLESRHRGLESALAELQRTRDLQYTIQSRRIDEQDWAESWKAFFHPEALTPNLVVKPTWRDYAPLPHQQVIEIDPGMAFGTGTHPTTAMCVELLENYVRQGHCVLDVGTGSGILLIAADKLGAARLAGTDLDPSAVAIARANLLQNRIAPQRFALTCGDLIDMIRGRFDLVVANILADVVVKLLNRVPGVLGPGGVFICSGVIQAHRDKVLRQMEAAGLQTEQILERGDWVAMAGRLKN